LLRCAAYEADNQALAKQAYAVRAAGQDAETTARQLVDARNALKVKYRALSPPDKVAEFEARKLNKYGNPVGPTADQLHAEGKFWDQMTPLPDQVDKIWDSNMATVPLERLSLKAMASGHPCLDLTGNVNWDQFPLFANELLGTIGASVYDKVESVEMRIWYLQFPRCQIRLVYDDFPQMVSLESNTLEGDELVNTLSWQLRQAGAH
jgi:hypothetical protein